MRSLTKSQARSLLSIAKLKSARSRHMRAISSRTRMDQTCLGWRGFFCPTSTLIPRSWMVAAVRPSKHGGSSANPPAASLYGEHNTIV